MLVLDVTQAAVEVSRLTREAYALNLPVEPGVRDGRDALVRWAVLLEEVIPKPANSPYRPLIVARSPGGAAGVPKGFTAHRPG